MSIPQVCAQGVPEAVHCGQESPSPAAGMRVSKAGHCRAHGDRGQADLHAVVKLGVVIDLATEVDDEEATGMILVEEPCHICATCVWWANSHSLFCTQGEERGKRYHPPHSAKPSPPLSQAAPAVR